MRFGASLLRTFLIGLVLGALPAAAQTTTGAVRGTVRTGGGEPVEGAVVQLRNADTGAARQAVTDESGRYQIDTLEPGSWTAVARLSDGRISAPQVLQARLQETVTLDFRVEVGASETVTVLAEPPLVDPLETGGKLRVTGQQAGALPLSGRVFTDLAKLDSAVGAAAPGNYFGERGAVFTVNGQSGRSNSFLVDGLDNNDRTSGTNVNAFYSQQVIDELVLMTHQYAPEFGRASGGVLNILTRRGGNDPSWQFFIQGGDADWNTAGNFVESLPDTGGQNALGRFQTGAWLSGPIKKDKAFYFVSYEHQETNNVIPYTGIDRDGVQGGRVVSPTDDDNLFFRADVNLTQTDTLMLRLSYDDRSTAGVNIGGLYTPDWGFSIEEHDLSLAASITSILSPDLFNEVRVLAATSSFDQFANSDLTGVTRPSGVFGGNNLNRQLRDEDRIQLVDNVTLRSGAHTMKFGVDIAASRTKIQTGFNPTGNLIYDYDFPFEPGDCGDLYVSLVNQAEQNGSYPLVPCPGTLGVDDDGDGEIDEPGNILSYPVVLTLIQQNPEAVLDDTQYAVFAQDRWQVNSKLLLDYGLRWDMSTYTLPASSAVDSVIPNGGAGRDTDNLAPRLGFSYTPGANRRLVIKGGGGVFYDKLVLGFPAVAAITSGTEIGLTFPQGLTFEITEDTIEDDGIETLLPELLFPDQLTMRFSTGTELQTPYTVQFTAGVQQAIGQRGAFQADLTTARGHNIPLMVDLNPVVCVPDDNSGDCSLVPVHRDSEKGSIAAIVTEGETWYNALELGYRYQKKESWLSLSYTWSKAEDMGFDPLKGGISLPPDSDNIRGERGRSDGDRRHRFVVSGNTGLGMLGLKLSGVLQYSTGLPFNVTTGQDGNLDGILSERPDGVGRNTGADTPLAAVNALRDDLNQILVQTGEEPLPLITSLEEPDFAQLDIKLYRPFNVTSGKGRGEAFLQVINLLDRENIGIVEGRAISSNFGHGITLAGPPRLVELGFKIGF